MKYEELEARDVEHIGHPRTQMKAFLHSRSYTGNPPALRAAQEVLSIFEEKRNGTVSAEATDIEPTYPCSI